jgi:NAD(P)-dependent dehydrogenase (short-subunit alcohol dehydrogenase family)
MPIALITGASAGLGRALTEALHARGFTLVLDARHADRLATVDIPDAHLIPGDVADPEHRRALVRRVGELGGIDLLVNNASQLGASPQPSLADLEPTTFADILQTNLIAPAALISALLAPLAARRGTVLNISSDAAVEHYPGWGGYGASKAALDHVTLTFAAEHPEIAWYAVDPGDMQTDLQQLAFPGEDISDRPLPTAVVPQLLALLAIRPPSGRYRASEFSPSTDSRQTLVAR